MDRQRFITLLILQTILLVLPAYCFCQGTGPATPVCMPMEKVYLHLDNTSYLHGDNIWFKAYVVNTEGNTMPPISNTLYVELLNPGGESFGEANYYSRTIPVGSQLI